MNKLGALVAIGVLGLVTACAIDDGGTAQSVPDAVDDVVRTTSEVKWHAQSGNEGPVEGATATLERTPTGLSLRVETAELNPGHAVTVWWVVVNNPQVCSAFPEPCTPPEILGDAQTQAEVGYGGGRVVDSSGRATFTSQLDVGPIPGGWLDGPGLTNVAGAEVHVTLNDHGTALEEFMPGMTQTYRGGCTDESLPEIFPPSAIADAEPGPNTCRLWQTMVFLP